MVLFRYLRFPFPSRPMNMRTTQVFSPRLIICPAIATYLAFFVSFRLSRADLRAGIATPHRRDPARLNSDVLLCPFPFARSLRSGCLSASKASTRSGRVAPALRLVLTESWDQHIPQSDISVKRIYR